MPARSVPQRKNNRHMTGMELLHKATGGFKYKTDNKMRGAFGETDLDKRVVRINKKKHTNPKALKNERRYNRNKDGTESILDTIVHEMGHVANPKAGEKKVEKQAKRLTKKMSPKVKKRIYAVVKK